MSFDPVPWFVGGGAEHSPEITRLLAYAATRGAEGVISVGDLKVSALATPGAGVTLSPGAIVLANASTGGSQQSYIARNPTTDTVTGIAATGAGAGRSDLVVVRIEDPQYAPWQPPADRRVGPYVRTFVVSNVPAGTTSAAALNLGYPAVALARLDIPASTGAISNAMIVDLRKMANPRRERALKTAYPSANNDLTSAAYTTWPAAAATTVDIPSWATQAIVRGTIASPQLITGDAGGRARINLGGQTTQDTGIDQNYTGGTPHRFDITVGGTLSLPSGIRGTTQTLKFEAQRSSGTGAFRAEGATTTLLDVEFVEAPV